MEKYLAICQIFLTFAPANQHFVQWCNGSTTGFGSVYGGSNPPWTTRRGLTALFFFGIAAGDMHGK